MQHPSPLSGYPAMRGLVRRLAGPCLLLLLLGLVLSATANAAPVVWVLQGVTFNDGGTVTGSFTYDPVTNVYSNVNITTTAGALRPGATYQYVCGQDVPSCNGVAPSSAGMLNLTSAAGDQTGLPGLGLFFDPGLDVTGVVSVSGQEATCSNATCTFAAAPARFIAGPAALAVAQVDYQVRYASNLTAGDSVINITNTGLNGAPLLGPGFGAAAGNICVNVYTFSPDEQLISCCSCLITPNGLASLSVRNDLIANPLTGVIPTSVVVKLLSTAAGANFTGRSCAASAAIAGSTGNQLAAGMRAWGTTIHGTAVTETPFSPASLSPGELASITGRCAAILGNGSGFGICRSCRLGALGAEATR